MRSKSLILWRKPVAVWGACLYFRRNQQRVERGGETDQSTELGPTRRRHGATRVTCAVRRLDRVRQRARRRRTGPPFHCAFDSSGRLVLRRLELPWRASALAGIDRAPERVHHLAG